MALDRFEPDLIEFSIYVWSALTLVERRSLADTRPDIRNASVLSGTLVES